MAEYVFLEIDEYRKDSNCIVVLYCCCVGAE